MERGAIKMKITIKIKNADGFAALNLNLSLNHNPGLPPMR